MPEANVTTTSIAATTGTRPPPTHRAHEPSIVETIQSLIVAFVLAMTFRGFVVEGFVIPTGSMAPTLMGAHMRVQSRQTGWEFPVGLDIAGRTAMPDPKHMVDPMLGPMYTGSAQAPSAVWKRMGDRILVIKCLYPFAEPDRFDVVVFKNPTKSQGDESNYIKRLIGLPNEDVWLCDGDVFASPTDGGLGAFHIQRKPEHVQRAVWQPVHDSDFAPINPDRVAETAGRRWPGPPWVGDSATGDAAMWDLTAESGRGYRCTTDGPAELRWDSTRRELNDWAAYNMLFPRNLQKPTFPVSDLRVCATIVPDRDGLSSTLELEARSHIFEFTIEPTRAVMRMLRAKDRAEVLSREAAIDLPSAGRAFTVECWHVDQSMRLFIDGDEVMPALTYDWAPVQRLQSATGNFDTDDPEALLNRGPLPPSLRWLFRGSPLTLQRVRVDRDLYYQPDRLPRPQEYPTHVDYHDRVRMGGPAFGTHPKNLGRLGPDQFMMCGDNSPMSQDSRLWGNPDPLVAKMDPAPFVVNRKLLLGKAWVVYFPSPYPVTEGGWPIIPDFGRLRFIR